MRVQEARVLELKLLVLTAAVTEIARALSPQDAASVARSLAALLTGLLDEARLSDRADEALACDLAPLMAALRREPSSSEGLVTRVAGGSEVGTGSAGSGAGRAAG